VNATLAKMRRPPSWDALALIALAFALGAAVYPAFAHALEVWSTTEEFGYGFLIPPISVALLIWRRDALRRSRGPGATGGLVIALVSLGAYLLAHRVGINALAGIAVCPLLWGTAVYLWGWRTGRELAFPIGFLVFGLGVYRGLLDTVGLALQSVTAVGAGLFASALGIPVIRDGLVLRSDQFAFIVAEACSGMSSLLSLLALAALWTFVAQGRLAARAAVILGVLPVVVLANTVRVTLVLVVAHVLGQDAALGFFHGVSSLVLFGTALVGLLCISRMVGCRLPNLAA
jgi:exosortase